MVTQRKSKKNWEPIPIKRTVNEIGVSKWGGIEKNIDTPTPLGYTDFIDRDEKYWKWKNSKRGKNSRKTGKIGKGRNRLILLCYCVVNKLCYVSIIIF